MMFLYSFVITSSQAVWNVLLIVHLCRLSFGRLPGGDPLTVPVSANQSYDDLWTDEDESLIRATQAFLDVTPKATRESTVGRLEFSKDKQILPAASSFSTVITSTPNVCSRVSRTTFGLEPASTDEGQKLNGQCKQHAKRTLPSASRSKASLVQSSLATTAEDSYTELLAMLAEPDVVLDTQPSDGNGVDEVKASINKLSGE